MSELTNNFKAPKHLELLLKTTYPPIEWLVDKNIPTESIVLLSAAPSSLKTWLMMDISIKVASGGILFDRFATSQTGVLILDEESGERQLKQRFELLGASKDLPIYCLSSYGRKLDNEYVEQLIGFCDLRSIKLIAFDSLRRFSIANENDSGEMSQVFELFSKFKNAGITCLILLHNRKSNGFGGAAEAIRGSSDILAACDVHIAISRQGNIITVTQTKNRLCEELKPFRAEFTDRDECKSFQFVNYIETKEDNENILKNHIVQKITDSPEMNKAKLWKALSAQSDIKIADHQYRRLLNELIDDKIVLQRKGREKNEYLLYINDDLDGSSAK